MLLLLTEDDVRRFLPMSECIRLMREAFSDLATGGALNQPRRRLILPGGAVLHYMAGGNARYFGTKIYSTHPAHGAHFVFLLYRAEDGLPLAILEANRLGQIRTGAATGLATDLMAAAGPTTVAMIGSGFQARTQLEAIRAVREVRDVRVWSRSKEKREDFAAACGAFAVESAEEAVRGAGIVVTATNARDPVLEASWISPGTHINAMGSNHAKKRELPADLIRRAEWVVVDSVDQGRKESGDLLMAGDDVWERVVELRNVVSGQVKTRVRGDEITIFKSNGLAVEDVAAAAYVYESAVADGVGRPLPIYS